MQFSVVEAIEYAKKDALENWVYKFLTTIGKNKKLAEIMKGKGFLEGPKKISLDELTRVCGPEAEMKFRESEIKWNKKVAEMIQSIEGGWEAPPLIAWKLNEKLSVADGSHRVEALKKAGYKSYWVIIWNNNSDSH